MNYYRREDKEVLYCLYICRIKHLIDEALEKGAGDTLAISHRDKIEDDIGNIHNLVDSTGATLLHYSVKRGETEVIRFLLEYGLDVDARTNEGQTPLMLATIHNKEETVHTLLKTNVKVDIADNFGETVFDKLSVGIIKDSSIPGMIMMKLTDKCKTEEEAAAKLFNAGCPLHLAVLMKSSRITKFYLERGVKNCVPSVSAHLDRASALHLAVYFQDLKSVELLLEYGADVNIRDTWGYMPIMYVRECQNYCQGEQLKILKCLLDGGADMTSWHGDGYGNMQIYSVLTNCSKEAVQLVLQANIDLSAKDSSGRYISHYMAGNKNPDVFTMLPVDVNVSNDYGLKALHFAVISGHISTIQTLIDHGADVNSQDTHGLTPLYWAVSRIKRYYRDIERVELLLQYGADCQILAWDKSTICKTVCDDCGNFDLVQPVLAHLALLESTGTPIKSEIIENISSIPRLQKSFSMYKRQLEQFKDFVIYESVTLYQLLTVSDKQLLAHLRNEQLALKLEQGDYKNNEGVYYRKLRLRIACAYENHQLKVLAAKVLCQIMRFCDKSYPIIIDMIYSNLNKSDLLQLIQI